MPLILPGNVGSATAATGFNVANSVRMNAADSAKMTIDFSGAGNQKKFTISCWVKRATITPDNSQTILSNYADVNNFCNFTLNTSDKLSFVNRDGGTFNTNIATTRLFRDPSSFYHVVLSVDTTQSTDTNRIKMYVNGVQETSFSTSTYPDQNTDLKFNTTATTNFGSWSGSAQYADGYFSELCFINDAQLAADQFGEFDSDNGIWKPIDVSGLTFGTNGFYLDFEDSGNLGNDANGGTDLTEVNLAATDQSIDTCTNNFCTMNPLANSVTAATFSEGNLVTSFANGRGACTSTFGLTTGKWYVEMNITTMPKDERFGLGISPFETKAEDLPHEANNQGLDISGYNAVIYANLDDGSQVIDNFFGNNTTRFDSFTGIIGMALDLTSSTKTIAFSKAGAWVTGGGTSDTDFSNALEVDISTAFARHNAWHVACGTGNGDGTNGIFSMNFGSPAFAISSGNTDGNGFGNFEYAVPSGYFAICTKNLAEYG